MQYVVFFRNVNLGHPNCPSSAQLENAFLEAGADKATSFQTNGTLVFSSRRSAAKLTEAACAKLRKVCDLKEPAMFRSLTDVATLVASEPFSGIDPGSVCQMSATILVPIKHALPPVPLKSPRNDVEVFQFTKHIALSVTRMVGKTVGSPNRFLEKHLGIAATTRNWSTIVRLVDRFA
jgi:uncharacterized protein (DUF1697 family)